MPFKFNSKKALQSIGILLKHSTKNESDNYMRILKLMYIADRKSLEEMGRPITGDNFIATERGPLLNISYDIIKGKNIESKIWFQYIEKERYNIKLIKETEIGELSRYEINLLQSICDENKDLDEYEMIKKTHLFKEWRKNYQEESSISIPLIDILKALGKEDRLSNIEKKAEISKAIDDFF